VRRKRESAFKKSVNQLSGPDTPRVRVLSGLPKATGGNPKVRKRLSKIRHPEQDGLVPSLSKNL
jgi:hypothetical protein